MLTAIRNGAIRRIRERVEDEDRSTVRSIAGPALSFPSAALWGGEGRRPAILPVPTPLEPLRLASLNPYSSDCLIAASMLASLPSSSPTQNHMVW